MHKSSFLKKLLIISALSFLFFPCRLLASGPVTIDESFTENAIGRHVEVFVDEKEKLTIDDILNQSHGWQKWDKDVFNFGFTEFAYWLRFSVEKSSQIPLFLEVDCPYLGSVDLFTPGEKGLYTVKKGGLRQPFSSREINDRNNIFHLDKNAGLKTYYLRVYSYGPLNFSVNVWSPEAFFEKTRKELAVLWMYNGLMIVMIIYNLFAFVSVKDRAFIYFALFISAYVFLQFYLDGFAFQYLWPDTTWWTDRAYPVATSYITVFMALFIRSFLETPRKFPRFDKLLLYCMVFPALILSVLSVIMSPKYMHLYQLFFSAWGTCCTLIIYLLILHGTILNIRQARFLLYGFSVFLIGVVLIILKTHGILYQDFITQRSMQIGSAIMAIVFSLGLADKINTMKDGLALLNDELADSEKKYRTLAENINDVIWILELPGLNYTYMSPSVERLRGFTPEEVKHHSLEEDTLTPASMELAQNTIAQELAKDENDDVDPKRSRILELEMKHKDGAIIMTEVTTTFIRDDQGKPAAILGVTRDITARKLAEKKIHDLNVKLEQRVIERTSQLVNTNKELEGIVSHAQLLAREAEAASIAKSNFLSSITHEIRTPMNSIVAMSDLIMDTNLTKKQEHYIDNLRASSKSLLKLINGILDYTKLDSGELNFEYSPVVIKDLINAIEDKFVDAIRDKEIKVTVDISHDVPDQLITDAIHLQQILMNLTSNAIKYTDNGEIIISVKNKYSSYETVELLFCVSDTGIGIETDQQEDLFSAFARTDYSTTRKYGGTGLGLAICKKIVNSMGGEIWVESEPGRGSAFYFTAGFTYIHGKTSSLNDFKSVLENLTVLVVEDNIVNQKVVTDMLKKGGVDVSLADTGAIAIQQIKKRSFDAVFMDIQMPEMDGLEATRVIREELKKEDLPIIAMTAHDSKESEQECFAVGMNDFVTKPIDSAKIFSVLKKNIHKLKDIAVSQTDKNRLPSAQANGFFYSLPGIHIESCLKRVSGNKELFIRILKEVKQNFFEAGPHIRRALAENETETALRLIHTVKGLAANCSAMDLHDAAKELEYDIKHGEEENSDTTTLFKDFEEALNTVLESIQVLMQKEKETEDDNAELDIHDGAGQSLNIPEIAVLLKELEQYLTENNPNAKLCLKSVKAHLNGAKYSEELNNLEYRINKLDYKKARNHLFNIANTLDIVLEEVV